MSRGEKRMKKKVTIKTQNEKIVEKKLLLGSGKNSNISK